MTIADAVPSIVDRGRIGEALAGLARTYTPAGVGHWLCSPHDSLGRRAPLDLIAEGDVDGFVSAVMAIGDWADRRTAGRRHPGATLEAGQARPVDAIGDAAGLSS